MRVLWSVERDNTLIELFNNNKTANEIADYFDCCQSQVYSRCRNLGIGFRNRNKNIEENVKPVMKHFNKVEIPCLRCRHDFLSEDIKRNRICNDCSRLNAGYVGVVHG